MWVPRSRLGLGKKATVFLVVSLLALSGVGMGLAYRQLTMKEAVQAASTEVNVGLTVKAYHAGQSQPFATRSLPHDMILNNFNVLLYDLVISGTALGQQNIYDTGNSPATPAAYNWANTYSSCSANTHAPSNTCGGLLAIGTGSTAVTASDYHMTTVYPTSGTEYFAISGAVTASDTGSPATAQITGLSGTQTINDNGISIQEAGLFAQWGFYSTPIMLFHDTFTPISVNSGDQVSVAYTISFNNVGFNNNLAKIVAGWLTDVATGGHVSITLANTGNAANNFYASCNIGTTGLVNVLTTSCTSASTTGQMNIGITTTTTYTPTSYQQYNPLLSTFATLSAGSYTAPNCYFTAAITWGTSTNWVDSGLYLKLSGTDYLIMVLSFATIPQASGTNGATIKSCNN